MTHNILALENPQEYECHVETYVIGRSELIVRVEHVSKSHHFHIHFSFVEYFSGATRWQGADLHILPTDSCLNVLRQVHRFRDWEPHLILQFGPYELYQFEDALMPVQVIAAQMEIVESLDDL